MKVVQSVTAIAAALLTLAVATRAAGPGVDFCRKTSEAALTSCRAAAQSDFDLALGKCDNLTDPADRKTCQQQAAAALRKALENCDDALAFRQAVCARLGGAPYDPVVDPKHFVSNINNPYFPLKPGTTFIYTGKTAGGVQKDVFSVTHNTKVILGVTCVEVHDAVYINEALSEDTLDWFAQDQEGNVWYFGENTHELTNGLISTIAGTFTAGINNDKPGIVMKAHPAIGDFYRQEFSLNNAEDLAETVSLTDTVTVPAGSFHSCLKSQETTPLEIGLLEYKFYAPGIGNVLTIDAHTGEKTELVSITTSP